MRRIAAPRPGDSNLPEAGIYEAARGSTNTAIIPQDNTFQDVETEVAEPHEVIDAGAAHLAVDDGTITAVIGSLAGDGGAKTSDTLLDVSNEDFTPGDLFTYTTKNSNDGRQSVPADGLVNAHDGSGEAGPDGGVGDWWSGFY